MAPFICKDHLDQLRDEVLNIRLEEKEERITYWRGDNQLVVKTDEVDGVQRRSLVFSLFYNMPPEIMESLPVSYYDIKPLSRVDKRFKGIYGKDWKTYFETAMVKNDIAVLKEFIPLVPTNDPLQQKLSEYLGETLKHIGGLDSENQLLLLKMYDAFFNDPNSSDKNLAILHLILNNMHKLNTLDNIKAVFEMNFTGKPAFLQIFTVGKMDIFKNDPEYQLDLLKMLLKLPNEYYANKRDAFERLRNKQDDIAPENKHFISTIELNQINFGL